MEPWSGVLEWILEWNDVRFRFRVLVTLVGQDFMIDRQTVMELSGVRFWRGSVG